MNLFALVPVGELLCSQCVARSHVNLWRKSGVVTGRDKNAWKQKRSHEIKAWYIYIVWKSISIDWIKQIIFYHQKKATCPNRLQNLPEFPQQSFSSSPDFFRKRIFPILKKNKKKPGFGRAFFPNRKTPLGLTLFARPKAARTAKHEGPSAACRIITVNWGPWGAVTRGLVGKRETRTVA